MQSGNIKDTVKFQKILIKTKSAYFMAIWQTDLGKKLLEIDGRFYLNSNEKRTFSTRIKNNLEQFEYREKKKQ
jgi:hypothetical protein